MRQDNDVLFRIARVEGLVIYGLTHLVRGVPRLSGGSLANVRAFQSIGEALRTYLSTTYPQELRDEFPCSFELVSTGQLAEFDDPTGDSVVACTLFLYRTTINEQLRNTLQPSSFLVRSVSALPLELHWMLSVWSNSAAAEQVVFAWALSQLSQQPLLDLTTLNGAGFQPHEVIHVLPEELELEQLMRIWESIQPSYRLSTTYVTRVVRLDVANVSPPPVVTSRLVVHPSKLNEQAQGSG